MGSHAEHACHMPDIMATSDQTERRVGVEIEFSGIGYEPLVQLVARLLEGTATQQARYVTAIETASGAYTVELDSAPIKDLDLQDGRLPDSIRELGGHAMDVIDAAAEKIVPMEIICPPLAFRKLGEIEHLCDELSRAGALGSREAIYYAFGLQLNPELPDLNASTVVRYMQGFATLYEWLKRRHQLDLSRKLTTYIEPWSSRYTDRLIEPGYTPDMTTLMRDYLLYNPTRNRALDMLPLFAHIDPELLAEYVDDPRIKSRPTLHYRLPDCDIDNPQWHFSTVWNDWVVLEQLVNNAEDLQELTEKFRASRQISFHNLTHSWPSTCDAWLRGKGYV